MKLTQLSQTTTAVLLLFLSAQAALADSIGEDLDTICGWYNSLATDAKYKSFTVEEKFSFVFDDKSRTHIKYMQIKMYYSALRTTHAEQRYPLMQAYAEGTLGKKWECPSMQTIMREFYTLDPLFQYSE
jgi:hypothetical protein